MGANAGSATEPPWLGVTLRHGLDPCATCDARSLSVCDALAGPDLDRLATIAVVMSVEIGQSFITEGDPADHFFNLTGGSAKLYKLLPDGRCQVTGFVQTGDFLGLAASTHYAFSAEALEPVQLCRFARGKFEALLRDCPAMERRLRQLASHELVMAQEQMLLLGRKSARERVASFLLSRSRGCAHAGTGERVLLPMTRTEIADYLGLTIETVSRTLSAFKTARLVAMHSPAELLVLDRKALDKLAAGGGKGHALT